jgi:hypothetical protein
MKADNQALKLEKLMQRHQCYPEYELCFSPIAVRKVLLKKLNVGDLLLLGLESMEMQLVSKSNGCAKAILASYDETMTIQIIEDSYRGSEIDESKKYKKLKILLGRVHSRVLTIGHKIETMHIDFEEILLYAEEKMLAKGRLVTVDDEIAVEIKEVKR